MKIKKEKSYKSIGHEGSARPVIVVLGGGERLVLPLQTYIVWGANNKTRDHNEKWYEKNPEEKIMASNTRNHTHTLAHSHTGKNAAKVAFS